MTETTPALLSREEFSQVVKLTPPVSIDLLVRDDMLCMPVGVRENRPAKLAGLRQAGTQLARFLSESMSMTKRYLTSLFSSRS